ncbi:MAG: hypothetical protein FWE90_08870 [Defluviitaleaceae bacterium]|nr:hypothetical protein [Defluviitaleaceae bacterium]
MAKKEGAALHAVVPWGGSGRMFQRRAERNRAMNGSVREVVARLRKNKKVDNKW